MNSAIVSKCTEGWVVRTRWLHCAAALACLRGFAGDVERVTSVPTLDGPKIFSNLDGPPPVLCALRVLLTTVPVHTS